MRRLFVTLIALSLVLGAVTAPAAAKRDKPGKPGKPAPSLEFAGEPWAEYLPDLSLCVADVLIWVERDPGSVVTLEASLRREGLPPIQLTSQEQTMRTGGSSGLPFSYDFRCESEIELDITHVATLRDRKGKELTSAQEIHTMNFLSCKLIPGEPAPCE